MRFTIRLLTTVILVLATASMVRVVIWAGPALYAGATQPSMRSECAMMHIGLTLSEADTLIHSRRAPQDEAFTPNGFVVSGYRGTCQIDLDPTTHKVIQATMSDGVGGIE